MHVLLGVCFPLVHALKIGSGIAARAARNLRPNNRMILDFSSKVPDGVVCSWFYAFYLVNLMFFTATFLFLMYYLYSAPGSLMKTMNNIRMIGALLSLGVTGTNSLFFYIICKRSLMP